jgi:GAF domain-containing protein
VIGFNDKDWKLWQAGLSGMQNTPELQLTLANLVKLASDAAGASSGSLYLVDKERSVLVPNVLYNLPDEYVKGCGEVRIGDQCCGRAVESKRPWIVSDMLTDPLFASAREASIVSGIRSGFSVPVIDAYNECIGSLGCQFREPHTPTSYEIERNHMFATLIAFALSSKAAEASPKKPNKNARQSKSKPSSISSASAD